MTMNLQQIYTVYVASSFREIVAQLLVLQVPSL